MKLSYDPRYNIAYLQLKETEAEVHTVSVSEEVNIDLAPDGTLFGIELLNARHQIGAAQRGGIILVNEESGLTEEFPLPF